MVLKHEQAEEKVQRHAKVYIGIEDGKSGISEGQEKDEILIKDVGTTGQLSGGGGPKLDPFITLHII